MIKNRFCTTKDTGNNGKKKCQDDQQGISCKDNYVLVCIDQKSQSQVKDSPEQEQSQSPSNGSSDTKILKNIHKSYKLISQKNEKQLKEKKTNSFYF